MPHLNIEIKAHTENTDDIVKWLKKNNADYKGVDHQTDTYFQVAEGRLKLRKGNIENALIFYKRKDQAGPKQSTVFLEPLQPDNIMKEILSASLGILVEVQKERQIWFVENVKIHLDKVKSLGHFVEIEAIDVEGNIGREKLSEQCQRMMAAFNIQEKDLIENSYSDMLMKNS